MLYLRTAIAIIAFIRRSNPIQFELLLLMLLLLDCYAKNQSKNVYEIRSATNSQNAKIKSEIGENVLNRHTAKSERAYAYLYLVVPSSTYSPIFFIVSPIP